MKATPYTTQITFVDPDTVGRCRRRTTKCARADDVPLRGRRRSPQEEIAAARAEVDAITALDAKADYKPYEPGACRRRTIVDTARLVAIGRIANAAGDLDARRRGLRRRSRWRTS